MAVVLKWKRDGQYLSRLVCRHGGFEAEWKSDRSKAIRCESVADLRRRVSAHFGEWPEWWDGQVSFVRLVPKRRADFVAMNFKTRDGVTLAAPATMSLGDVYRVLRGFPALRVCFDAEVKRAVEKAQAEAAALREERDQIQREWENQGARLHELESRGDVKRSVDVVRVAAYRQGQEEMRDRGAVILDAAADLADAARSELEARRYRALSERIRSIPIANAPTASASEGPGEAKAIPGATPRDAVAGMLLRHGFNGWARAVSLGASPEDAAKQLGPASPVDGVRPEHAACIAALVALAATETT